jgi:glycerate-2-kinase
LTLLPFFIMTSREILQKIYHRALLAANPKTAVQKKLLLEGDVLRAEDQSYQLSDYRHIYLLGVGKAAYSMAYGVWEVLGGRITEGLILTKDGSGGPLGNLICLEASHPIPDQRGYQGARQIWDIAHKAEAEDLIIYLFSGGASSLTPLPMQPLSLEDKQITTQILLEAGATVVELNAVRKHLSAFKGGRLAQEAYPAAQIALILSDVVGDRLDFVGSGPTCPDTSSFTDCWWVVEKYKLEQKLPPTVFEFLNHGKAGLLSETPKKGDPLFNKVQNVLVANNRASLVAAQEEARALGYTPLLVSHEITGEAEETAKILAKLALDIQKGNGSASPLVCLVAGGETTVKLKGESGKGGRCQEMALAAAIQLQGQAGISFLFAGSDGQDGPTEAAGAFAFTGSVARAKARGLDAEAYLVAHNSYSFFEQLDDLLLTGPTGTNVMDFYLGLVNPLPEE